MALSPDQLIALSSLLDEALELPSAQRAAWLARLPPLHPGLSDVLRKMLDEVGHAALDQRLSAPPPLVQIQTVEACGNRVGPYRLLREIGRGGMGSVWLAERADGNLKRQVALKMPRLAWDEGLAARMARERDIGALLEHPHIARLYDAGFDERMRPYLVMEFVDGLPIDEWCTLHGLALRERLRLFLQVVRAVAYAHARLVVHRDLKPTNVLVAVDGSARLLDFGIAKLLDDDARGDAGITLERGRALTPCYASPEQIEGHPVTVLSDIYSLGVLLYELLTGHLPVRPKRDTPAALESAIVAGETVPASRRTDDQVLARALRGDIDAILGRALQVDPARRYATADALAQDIERYLTGLPVSARPDSVGYRLRKALRRQKLAFAAGAVALMSILGGGSMAIRQWNRAAIAAEREQVVKGLIGDVLRASLTAPHASDNSRDEVGQAVDSGVRLIGARLAGQPALQAEMQGLIGSVYESMGAYAYAAEYQRHALEALQEGSADSAALANAEMRLAEQLLRAGKTAQAAPHAEQANRLPQTLPSTRHDALALLARVQLADGRPDEAVQTLDRLEAALSGVREDSLALAWLRAGRALWLISQSRGGDEAYRLLEQAIDTAIRCEGPLSPAAIDIRLALARERGRRERRGDAQAQHHLAAALQALTVRGGADALRAAYERAQMWWLLPGDPYPSYALVLEELHKSQSAIDSADLPVPALMRAEMAFFRGQVEVQYGNVTEAGRWLSAGRELVLHANEAPAPRFRALGYLSIEAQDAGRHDEADALLVERHRLRAAMGQEHHLYSVYDFISRATNLMMAGRHDEAARVLKGVPHFDAAGRTPTMPRALVALHYNTARLELEAGRPFAAQAAIADVPSDSEATDGVANGAVLRAQLQCAEPRTARAGVAALEREVESQSRVLYEYAPYLAWLRTQAGLCALSLGDATTAKRRAFEARTAFQAQPGVSAFYKAPLERLEQQLRRPREDLALYDAPPRTGRAADERGR